MSLPNKFFSVIGVAFLFVMVFESCNKDEEKNTKKETPETGISMSIKYVVDADALMGNCFMYKTPTGYAYCINKLQYYLSEINLIKSDNSLLLVKNYHYTDAFVPETNTLLLKDIPAGSYIGIQFNIGVDSIHNKTGALVATTENVNMLWPDQMGGGYHFLKMEGSYKDNAGTNGFAIHTGTNKSLTFVKLLRSIAITSQNKTPLSLVMNINEWFRNPNLFDFNVDGNNSIMGNIIAMKKIAANGTDVFSIVD